MTNLKMWDPMQATPEQLASVGRQVPKVALRYIAYFGKHFKRDSCITF